MKMYLKPPPESDSDNDDDMATCKPIIPDQYFREASADGPSLRLDEINVGVVKLPR